MTTGRPIPRKRAGVPTGPRRLNGLVLDVATMARELGCTEKRVRSQAARGFLPYRKDGGRVVFLRHEVLAFLDRLPGVTAEQALANIAQRGPSVPAEPAAR